MALSHTHAKSIVLNILPRLQSVHYRKPNPQKKLKPKIWSDVWFGDNENEKKRRRVRLRMRER